MGWQEGVEKAEVRLQRWAGARISPRGQGLGREVSKDRIMLSSGDKGSWHGKETGVEMLLSALSPSGAPREMQLGMGGQIERDLRVRKVGLYKILFCRITLIRAPFPASLPVINTSTSGERQWCHWWGRKRSRLGCGRDCCHEDGFSGDQVKATRSWGWGRRVALTLRTRNQSQPQPTSRYHFPC